MNIISKTIAVFLVLSLIFVGITNLLSSNREDDSQIAHVGKESISLDEYRLQYQGYSNNASSLDVAKKKKRVLLDHMIVEKLLLNLTHDLGLEVGEESVKDYVKNIKYFHNDNGKFDKERFYKRLNSLNITEKQYLLKVKEELQAQMLMKVLLRGGYYPVTFGKKIDYAIHQRGHHGRIVDIIKVTKDAVTDIPEPDEQSLLNLYEQNKANFTHPEYRAAKYIYIEPELKYLADQIDISDAEIDVEIEKRALKDRRDLFNLIFSTKDEADQMRLALLERKVDFEQLANLEDIKISNATRDFLPENMRDIVFSLKDGEISEVLQSSFGWHLIKIVRVYHISDQDLLDVRKNLKLELTDKKLVEKSQDLINRANYKIYSGATIEEISREYNLPLHTTGPIDNNGRYQNGTQADLPVNLISFIFSRKNDQKSLFKSLNNGAIVGVKISEIIQPAQQTFAESRSSVLELWRNRFTTKRMFEIGLQIVNQLKNSTNIEEIHGIKRVTAQKIHRNDKSYPFSFVQEVFDMKMFGSVTNPIRHNNEFIIGILKEISLSSGQFNTLENGTHTMISLQEQLIDYLKSKYTIKINHSLLDQV